MGVQQIDWAVVAAPLVLAAGAVVVRLVDAFAGAPRTRRQALGPSALTLPTVGVAPGPARPRREGVVPSALARLPGVVAAGPAAALWGQDRSTFCTSRPASEVS